MSYTDRFLLLDALIGHLDTVVPVLPDPFLRSQHVGFLTVSVVTVFELSIKDIFLEFSRKKNGAFGTYCGNVMEKMNGRISLRDLREVHVPKFGEKYLAKFRKKLEVQEQVFLRSSGFSVKSSYGNVVVWRNSFAHEGVLPVNATYAETCKGYDAGKIVLRCLAESMIR